MTNLQRPHNIHTKMSERETTLIDPTREQTRVFADRIMPVFLAVLDQVKSQHDLSADEKEVHGETQAWGKKLEYTVQTEIKEDGINCATITLAENKPKSVKVSRLLSLVIPKFQPAPEQARRFRFLGGGEEVKQEVGVSVRRGFIYEYEAGERGRKEETLIPSIETYLEVRLNSSGRTILDWLSHRAMLSNPQLGDPRLELAVIGKVEEGKFRFGLGVYALDESQGEIVTGSFIKHYQPVSKPGKPTVYKGEAVVGQVYYPMPKPFNVEAKPEELEKFKLGRANSARLARYLPSQFTQDQVELMFANAISGKAFTTGVWNPLLVPGARRLK